jgi:alpha-glucosidase
MLTLYRDALRLRRETEGLYAAGLAWREAPEGVLDFDRGGVLRCVANLSGVPVAIPADRALLSSIPLEGGLLPTDATAWLRP